MDQLVYVGYFKFGYYHGEGLIFKNKTLLYVNKLLRRLERRYAMWIGKRVFRKWRFVLRNI